MALRGLLLLVTVGLFAAVWQGDQTNQARRVARHELPGDSLPSCGYVESWRTVSAEIPVIACSAPGRSLTRFVPLHEQRWFEPCIEGEVVEFAPASRQPELDTIPLAENDMFVACEPPLPEGIAPGEYRVVGSRGEMFPLELTAEEIVYHGLTAGSTPLEMYQIEQDGRRWYFIRVEAETPRLVEQDPSDDVPAVAEQPGTAIDWSELTAQLQTQLRCDLQMAAWCGDEACNRWNRRLAALFRRGNAWAAEMTESLQHSLERIRRTERISDSNQDGPRL